MALQERLQLLAAAWSAEAVDYVAGLLLAVFASLCTAWPAIAHQCSPTVTATPRYDPPRLHATTLSARLTDILRLLRCVLC